MRLLTNWRIFIKNTGLKANLEKSTIFRVGSKRGMTEKLDVKAKFKWSNDNISVLGLLIQLDNLNYIQELNFESVIKKAEITLSSWAVREMSILGKIEIVNTLVSSLFVYLMQMVPTVSSEQEKVIKLITQFIWNGRKPKIRNNVLCLNKHDGGRRLANLMTRDKSLKIQWLNRLSGANIDPVIATLAYYFLNTKIKNTLFWECNLAIQDIKQFEIKN